MTCQEIAKEARYKVHKYHYTTLATHNKLLKRVEENPRTLFVIVADEAHVAITNKAGEEFSEHAEAASKSVWSKKLGRSIGLFLSLHTLF